jgi:hypothetical protein
MEETGEYGEQELNHSDGEAERFSRELKGRGVSVRVGMEATGHARWFERLLAELGFQSWIVDPADWNSDGDCCALIRLPSLLTTPIPVVWHNHDTALRFRLPTSRL